MRYRTRGKIQLLNAAILTFLLIILAGYVSAQDMSRGFKLSHPQLDGSTLGHIGMGGLTYTGFRLVGVDKKASLVAVLAVAVAYEFIHDGLGLTKYSDPAGADFVGDVTANSIGGALLACLEILLRIDKRIDLYACENRIGIRIAI